MSEYFLFYFESDNSVLIFCFIEFYYMLKCNVDKIVVYVVVEELFV